MLQLLFSFAWLVARASWPARLHRTGDLHRDRTGGPLVPRRGAAPACVKPPHSMHASPPTLPTLRWTWGASTETRYHGASTSRSGLPFVLTARFFPQVVNHGGARGARDAPSGGAGRGRPVPPRECRRRANKRHRRAVDTTDHVRLDASRRCRAAATTVWTSRTRTATTTIAYSTRRTTTRVATASALTRTTTPAEYAACHLFFHLAL